MQLHLFGATTATGESFRQQLAIAEPSWLLHSYSRRSVDTPANFTTPSTFRPASGSLLRESGSTTALSGIFIFSRAIIRNYPHRLTPTRGLIVVPHPRLSRNALLQTDSIVSLWYYQYARAGVGYVPSPSGALQYSPANPHLWASRSLWRPQRQPPFGDVATLSLYPFAV